MDMCINMTNTHFELLPIEINAPQIMGVLRSQLEKGVALTDIVPAIETGSLQKIREDVTKIADGESESEYIRVKRAIHEVFKWLEYLVIIRKEILSSEILPEAESAVIQNIETQLHGLLGKLDPVLRAIAKKREVECRDIGRVLKETIDFMERETSVRAKKIVLDYEKLGEETYAKVQSTFDQFFTHLRAHSDTIIGFIKPRMSEWNVQALQLGRGFLIDSIPNFPCSILFSIKGECHLLFDNIGHLLGSGLDKLVLRSICLPQGKIQALIKPIFHEEPFENISAADNKLIREERQFLGMWQETEMLMKLKGEKGIIALEERMAFEWDGEKKLFLAEDYYWDGNLGDYLKYLITDKIESAKIPPIKQRKVLSDLLEGLVAIHKNHIVHHDIKPDNILLDLQKRESSAVIADFHLATYIGDASRITNIGFVPKWAPPEYAKIELNPDRPFNEILRESLLITTGKLDVWGMGLIFYALTAYELPFWVQMGQDSNDPSETEKLFSAIASLKKGWLPEHLKSSAYFPLLEKMLEPEPSDRCTAQEALDTLRGLAAHPI